MEFEQYFEPGEMTDLPIWTPTYGYWFEVWPLPREGANIVYTDGFDVGHRW